MVREIATALALMTLVVAPVLVLDVAGDVKVLPPQPLDDLPNLDSKGQRFP